MFLMAVSVIFVSVLTSTVKRLLLLLLNHSQLLLAPSFEGSVRGLPPRLGGLLLAPLLPQQPQRVLWRGLPPGQLCQR